MRAARRRVIVALLLIAGYGVESSRSLPAQTPAPFTSQMSEQAGCFDGQPLQLDVQLIPGVEESSLEQGPAWQPPSVITRTSFDAGAQQIDEPSSPQRVEDPWGSFQGGEPAFTLGADPQISVCNDIRGFLPRLWHDSVGVVNNWNNLAILGVSLGGALAVRSELDQSVRNYTAEHPNRWGEGTQTIGKFGQVEYQLPVIAAAYAFTVYTQNDKQHAMMTSLLSAYTITGLSDLVIKGIADTSRPTDAWNGGKYGFPSYHTSSMFAISAVLDSYEGPWVGVPMYVLSGLVGWSRIDMRDHDLSDVVFGAALGYVIGKSVSGKALFGDSRVHLLPYTHPTDGSPGLRLETTY
jgi:hypothetical protein